MKFGIAGRHKTPPVSGAVPEKRSTIWFPSAKLCSGSDEEGPYWTVEINTLEQLMAIVATHQEIGIDQWSPEDEPEININPHAGC